MVSIVKCPIAFDVLALYALTNFIGELKFKITCIVGWIQHNSEELWSFVVLVQLGAVGRGAAVWVKGPWEDCWGRSSS